jgi:hypothetical protein
MPKKFLKSATVIKHTDSVLSEISCSFRKSTEPEKKKPPGAIIHNQKKLF